LFLYKIICQYIESIFDYSGNLFFFVLFCLPDFSFYFLTLGKSGCYIYKEQNLKDLPAPHKDRASRTNLTQTAFRYLSKCRSVWVDRKAEPEFRFMYIQLAYYLHAVGCENGRDMGGCTCLQQPYQMNGIH